MARKKLSTQKATTTKPKFQTQMEEWTSEYSLEWCKDEFIVEQLRRNNAPSTIGTYKRFFVIFERYTIEFYKHPLKEIPVDFLKMDMQQRVFIEHLQQKGLGVQTINGYLRELRAFGNYCLEQGYIDHFTCPIKEVQPPVKQVYTEKELEKLMVKPKIEDFCDFRTYCIISLILNTGARSNTILNIRISDVDLEEGYVSFNTTKAHKVARLGLDKKTARDLREWIKYWRIGKGASEDDFLFCNQFGEQLAKATLAQSLAKYNRARGVEKTSIHLLRHTFAKNWITSGGDIVTLARVLTHSQLIMVQRYANLYSTDIKAEIEEHSIISQMRTKSGKTLRTKE